MIEGERGGERVWDALHPNALQIEKSTAYRENSLEVRGTRGEMRGARGVGREARGESYVLCRVTGEVGARVEREVLHGKPRHFSCSAFSISSSRRRQTGSTARSRTVSAS
jgi:hypothetical protein